MKLSSTHFHTLKAEALICYYEDLLDQANPVDEFLNGVLTSQLFTESPERLGSDLASLNIMRGRDHGGTSDR